MKCTRTGRTCDGYTVSRRRSPQSLISLRNPLQDFPGTEREHRYLAFFYRHTAPVISGCFDFDFWNELLPRVGQTEPTIQHAMISVGAVYARESGNELLSREESQRFELQQYNKAIRHLRRHLSENGVTIEVTLSFCVLLICLELLRGSIVNAILHLQGGLSILDQASGPSYKLKDIFYRLDIQWALCGRPSSDGPGRKVLVSQTFASLEEARSSLDHLNSRCLKFINMSMRVIYTSQPDSLAGMYTLLSEQLQNWSDNFEQFVTRKQLQSDRRSTLLRVFHLTASIWLSACMSPDETAFDDQLDRFASIVKLASSVRQNAGSFTFEMGVIAPLYFTAIKCRDCVLRRDAISLLSSAMPRREGLWDAGILEYVGRRVIDIEEARGYGTPAEEDRIVHVTINYKQSDGDYFSIIYVMKRSQGWVTRREDVVLGRELRGDIVAQTVEGAIALAITAFNV